MVSGWCWPSRMKAYCPHHSFGFCCYNFFANCKISDRLNYNRFFYVWLLLLVQCLIFIHAVMMSIVDSFLIVNNCREAFHWESVYYNLFTIFFSPLFLFIFSVLYFYVYFNGKFGEGMTLDICLYFHHQKSGHWTSQYCYESRIIL